jgi:hypothetical protein
MTPPEQLARIIRDFLAEAGSALVLEDGIPVFDFCSARY